MATTISVICGDVDATKAQVAFYLAADTGGVNAVVFTGAPKGEIHLRGVRPEVLASFVAGQQYTLSFTAVPAPAA